MRGQRRLRICTTAAAPAPAEAKSFSPVRVGIAYRPPLATWIDSRPAEVQCLEARAEQFYKGGERRLRALAQAYPLIIRTSRLSLGTPGPVDPDELEWFAALAAECGPLWICEHLGFRRTPEVDLAYSAPVPLTQETLDLFVAHARTVVDRCGTPLILANVITRVKVRGTMSEPEFLNRFADASGCGLLLDVTSLAVNARNQGVDPRSWLAEIDPGHLVQLNVGAHAREAAGWTDPRADRVQEDLWELVEEVVRAGTVRVAILERDGAFPHVSELAGELRRFRAMAGKHDRLAGSGPLLS